MKAAVCNGEGQQLVVEEITCPPPEAGEVKVQVAACAICQSDLHYMSGAWTGVSFPILCGHEVAGTVVETGKSVHRVREGHRAIVSLIRDCGVCKYCKAGHPYLCATALSLDTEPRFRNANGARVYQGLKVGGFAEYVVVHASQVATIPDAIPFDHASLLACGVLTGYGAVANAAKMPPGVRVAVIGIGGVGINCVQAAVIGQAETVIAIDLAAEKFALAEALGATHTLNPNQTDIVGAVMEITDGEGLDFVFIAAGSGAAIEQGAPLLSKLGCMVLAGMPPSGVTFKLDPERIVGLNQSIIGTKMGSSRLSEDVPKLIEQYQQGRLKLAELIAARYPLNDINKAIASAGRGEAARNVILFDGAQG